LSPSAFYAVQEYFAGRLIIFMRAFAATSLDKNNIVSTIVHEFILSRANLRASR
jgi:hypothetical protein